MTFRTPLFKFMCAYNGWLKEHGKSKEAKFNKGIDKIIIIFRFFEYTN